MKVAIVVLTNQGLRTACKIVENWSEQEQPELWVHQRLQGQGSDGGFVHGWQERSKPQCFAHLREVVPRIWQNCSLLIFIMATGIVVRQIAPLLESKERDPAVLVLDEKGEFVISLLSGHLGGANAWAKTVAQWLDAQPVVTTATDVQGLTAPDEYARRFDWCVEPVAGLREVNRFLLEEGYLKVWTDCLPEEHALRQDVSYRFLSNEDKEQAHIWITPYNIQCPMVKLPLLLIPKMFSIGVGCRRGVSSERIREAIQLSLRQLGISIKSVKGIFSIDLKAEEAGILEVAQTLGIPFKTFSAEQIQEVNESRRLVPSKFVKEKIGVDGVCEAASLLGTRQGELVLPKQKCQGITVAISKEKSM